MSGMAVQCICLVLLSCVLRMALAGCGSSNCVDCTESSGWIGQCRWCTRDNECHNKGSLMNPCKRSENIVDKSHCNDEFSRYNTELSYKMLLLSSAAYDPVHPQKCLNNALPSSEFHLQIVVTEDCDILDGRCSGYVAVSHIEKAIVVAFRGTERFGQALAEFIEGVAWPKTPFLDGEVQNYWNRAFEKLWECMVAQVKSLHAKYPHYQLWVTGHSLGGTIASMASTWLAYYNVAPRKDIILYTFGMPRVGNYDYALQHDRLVNNSWRVVNYDDLVPHFPSLASVSIINGPYHHGVEAYYTEPATSVNSNHKECHGKPFNEDKGCSFTTFPYSIARHKEYFSIPVGTFWEKQCLSSSRKKRATAVASNNTNAKFIFSKGHCSVYKYENGTYDQMPKQKHTVSMDSSLSTPLIASFVNVSAVLSVFIVLL